MQQIIAIGGADSASVPGGKSLVEYVLAQAQSPAPKVCYLPQAGSESREYIVQFYETFTKLGARPSWFSLFGNVTPDWPARLLDQDILYVGGGNTRSMLALWREWGVDVVLRQALEQGIVLAGVSAGAICWFDQGITDSTEPLSALDCLGFLTGSYCPHYDSELERRPTYRHLVMNDQAMPGLALDDGAAGHFVDGQLKRIVTSLPNAGAYRLSRQDNTAVEEKLSVTYLNENR